MSERGSAAADGARPRRGLLPALGALSAFGPISMDLYLPALPALTRELGAATSVAQLTVTACLIGLALGQIRGHLSPPYVHVASTYARVAKNVRAQRVPTP